MRINLMLRKDKPNKDGLCYVNIRISDKGASLLIPTAISVLPEKWCGGGVIADDIKTTSRIISKLEAAERVVARLELTGFLSRMTIKQVKAAIHAELFGSPLVSQNNFISFFEEYAEMKDTARTREIYRATIKALERYDSKVRTLNFEDITPKYLTGFSRAMVHGTSLNGAAIHLRNIRAVFNAAIDDEITNYYPFRKFKIKHSPTQKKNLGLDKFRELWNCSVAPHQQKYLDFWKLSFLLIGANTKDLCENCSMRNGRIEYIRAKTHKAYSIKVEPEALEIINKYRGKGRLLSFSEHMKDYKVFAMKVQRELKRLGGWKKVSVDDAEKYKHKERVAYDITFEGLTMYHARHTWASFAAALDIPKETIAQALGHSQKTVTDIYIDFDTRKVDDANRRVIDYALYGRK